VVDNNNAPLPAIILQQQSMVAAIVVDHMVDRNKSAVAGTTVVDGDCNNPPWCTTSTATIANGNNMRGRTATIRW
jgi:predicted acyltransferase (DUF342 family)